MHCGATERERHQKFSFAKGPSVIKKRFFTVQQNVPVGTKNHPTVESGIGREKWCAFSFVAPQPRPTPAPPPERLLGRCNRILRRRLIRLRLRYCRRCGGRSRGAEGAEEERGRHCDDGAEEEHGGVGAGEKHGGGTEEEYGGGGSGFLGLQSILIARKVTFLPFHLSSLRGTAPGTELVLLGTKLYQPLDRARSNSQDFGTGRYWYRLLYRNNAL
uniref:Expressed protein n=1 Tax=Oryza sativa subsp. japonica TaxID=39947 RepID=Q2R058_ORYSJ|nr:expressed protein [Oryza sativa Japonica Group]